MSDGRHDSPSRRMPAEWEPHAATWIAWPHHEPDWPDKLSAVAWAYTEIVRLLSPHERVEILCHDEPVRESAVKLLTGAHLDASRYRLHVVPNDRSWLRDSAPTGVRGPDGPAVWVAWRFNGWARYDNHKRDAEVPAAVETISGLPCTRARRPDGRGPVVMEGGAIDTDGDGTLLTTEECLLSDVQCRNPGLTCEDYEAVFAEYLGIRRTIWLGRGIEGDDTHGHVDDVARFVGPATVVLAYEEDPADANHEASVDNLARLEAARDARGRRLRVIRLPMPAPVIHEDERFPASYANFYVANSVVLVPTFNDPNDRVALETLADCFPDRQVIGVHARDLVWGNGTLHCLTQQQPAG